MKKHEFHALRKQRVTRMSRRMAKYAMRKFIDILKENIEIDDEVETPDEQAAWERQGRIEKAIQKFCEQEVGLSFGNRTYQIHFDEPENEITICPDDEEISLEQLSKFRVMGKVMVACASSYELNIKIKTPPGFNIST